MKQVVVRTRCCDCGCFIAVCLGQSSMICYYPWRDCDSHGSFSAPPHFSSSYARSIKHVKKIEMIMMVMMMTATIVVVTNVVSLIYYCAAAAAAGLYAMMRIMMRKMMMLLSLYHRRVTFESFPRHTCARQSMKPQRRLSFLTRSLYLLHSSPTLNSAPTNRWSKVVVASFA